METYAKEVNNNILLMIESRNQRKFKSYMVESNVCFIIKYETSMFCYELISYEKNK